ncbi:hypothetical protein TOPH_07801 [Tolypocladium ophioglossoides CBS 100239]|uniref:Uncharacterized protein n=1 Tax=Tolypocladium ophioglossoides (strain CBS 100239) TaxID=1163406 RepID=A0A0L0N139_TOLOC|nr:hypothetical protein TOPH_07801 [Tolypocladium ophioglossoides CBS 100239]
MNVQVVMAERSIDSNGWNLRIVCMSRQLPRHPNRGAASTSSNFSLGRSTPPSTSTSHRETRLLPSSRPLQASRQHVQKGHPSCSQAEAQVIGPALAAPVPPLDIPPPHAAHRRDPAQKGLPREHEAARPQHPVRARRRAALLPARRRRRHPAAPAPRAPLPAGLPDDPHRPRRHPLRALGRDPHGPRPDVQGGAAARRRRGHDARGGAGDGPARRCRGPMEQGAGQGGARRDHGGGQGGGVRGGHAGGWDRRGQGQGQGARGGGCALPGRRAVESGAGVRVRLGMGWRRRIEWWCDTCEFRHDDGGWGCRSREGRQGTAGDAHERDKWQH